MIFKFLIYEYQDLVVLALYRKKDKYGAEKALKHAKKKKKKKEKAACAHYLFPASVSHISLGAVYFFYRQHCLPTGLLTRWRDHAHHSRDRFSRAYDPDEHLLEHRSICYFCHWYTGIRDACVAEQACQGAAVLGMDTHFGSDGDLEVGIWFLFYGIVIARRAWVRWSPSYGMSEKVGW